MAVSLNWRPRPPTPCNKKTLRSTSQGLDRHFGCPESLRCAREIKPKKGKLKSQGLQRHEHHAQEYHPHGLISQVRLPPHSSSTFVSSSLSRADVLATPDDLQRAASRHPAPCRYRLLVRSDKLFLAKMPSGRNSVFLLVGGHAITPRNEGELDSLPLCRRQRPAGDPCCPGRRSSRDALCCPNRSIRPGDGCCSRLPLGSECPYAGTRRLPPFSRLDSTSRPLCFPVGQALPRQPHTVYALLRLIQPTAAEVGGLNYGRSAHCSRRLLCSSTSSVEGVPWPGRSVVCLGRPERRRRLWLI